MAMSISDSEVELQARARRVDKDGEVGAEVSASRSSRPPRTRPSSAPCRSQLQLMDLQAMTEEAVALFKSGLQQEALEVAVAFANMARQQLGRTHPDHISALATVAALADQMGCSEEAAKLMGEAEGLHEEHVEAVQIELEQEIDEVLAEMSSEEETVGRAGGSAFLTGVDVEDSDDDNSVQAPGSIHSGADGDVDALAGDDLDDEDLHNEVEEEEAQAITRLSWEVNALLKDGKSEMAAQLLTEAERLLLDHKEDPSQREHGSGLQGMTRAALHTLWAAVLESVGESEKAACLYDEALVCLKDEVGMRGLSSSDSSGEEEDSEEESTDKDDIEEAQDDSDEEKQREEKDEEGERDESETAEEESRDRMEDSEVMRKQAEAREMQRKFAEALEAKKAAEMKPEAEELEAMEAEEAKKEVENAEALEAKVSEEDKGDSKPATPTPAKPKVPTPPPQSKLRKPPSAVMPSAPKEQAAVPKGVVRVGGGFAIPSAHVPKAPPGKKPPQAPRKAKAKAAPKAKVEPEVPVSSPEPSASPEPLAEAEAAASPEPSASPEPVKTVEEQREQVRRVMTTADHFLGLMMFERAADVLEEQLELISDEASPHRNSDLHVEVLSKYAGILWWHGDLDGAVDGFTAADEVLADRLRVNQDPVLQRRRTQVWGQLAQVYRCRGELDLAEERLTSAVECLLKLCKVQPPASSSSSSSDQGVGLDKETTSDMLRDMQAALGQVCVQKKDYTRAERLYLAAFAPHLGLGDVERAHIESSGYPASDAAKTPIAAN
eukprot:TRINITY_DN37389_c0_g1_i1.p1 TRINITY_DN37389_c0_g1~~TRINITY_DN37389_c0_g1_i1.p1  ORF type:complete len:779 (-),score=255.44 TRINITY_DN37389_c0_g1_i1:23-2359(-)